MHGAAISPWTMSYFATSLLSLAAALLLMTSGFGFPSAPVEAADTLVVVHLVTIGWLGLLFCGALLQFVPVLVAAPARLPVVAGPALALIVCGLASLLAGFLGLGGRIGVDPFALPVGAVLLILGFGGLIASFAATILSVSAIDLSGRLVLTGLAALALTITLGAAMAFSFAGISMPPIENLVAEGKQFHAALGGLGWMTVAAIGVSYRLFSMFMLAPEGGRASSHWVLRLVLASLALLAGAAIMTATVIGGVPVLLAAALLTTSVAIGIYLFDIAAIYRARRRKQLELNSIAGLAAAGFLPVALLMLAFSLVSGNAAFYSAVAYYLLGLGWLSGLGLAQLYKIVPFLTWMENYGPVMGRAPVPRVQDLVDEKHGGQLFVVWFGAVAAGAVALLAGSAVAFRLASLCQLFAVGGLMVEYGRARCLAYAPESMRHPGGRKRPRLIFPLMRMKE